MHLRFLLCCIAGKILLTEFFNRDDHPDVTSMNNRPLIPCYEAEDLIVHWLDLYFVPAFRWPIWFKSRRDFCYSGINSPTFAPTFADFSGSSAAVGNRCKTGIGRNEATSRVVLHSTDDLGTSIQNLLKLSAKLSRTRNKMIRAAPIHFEIHRCNHSL